MGNKSNSTYQNHPKNNEKKQKNQNLPFFCEQSADQSSEFYNLIIGVGQNSKSCILHFETQSEKLIELHSPQDFPCFNYSSVVMESPEKIYLTGGITKNLTEIKDIAFQLNLTGYEPKFSKLPHLLKARYTHMSIVFKGCLYVFGGRTYGSDSIGILNSCEKLFLEGGNAWIPIASMKKNRCTGFVMIYQEHIYAFGGYTGPKKRSKAIERYNEQTDNWEIIEFKLKEGIEAGTLFPFDLDQFLIIGGNNKDGLSSKSYLYDLEEQTIKEHSSLNKARVLQKNFIDLKNGYIYVLGGDINNSCERFSFTKAEKWESVQININAFAQKDEFKSFSFVSPNINVYSRNKNIPEIKVKKKNIPKSNEIDENENILPIYEDNLFYIFGTDAEPFIIEYNLTKNNSRIINPKDPLKLQSYQGGVKTSSHVYFLAGGISSTLETIYKDTFLYMSFENMTLSLENMSVARYTFNVVFQYPYVYVLGGRTYGNDEKGVLDSCERFHLEKHSWEIIASLNFKRCTAMAFSWSNGIYIAGGYMGNLKRETRFECYIESINKWEIMGIELLEELEASSFLLSENNLLFIGGRIKSGDTDKIWSYDVSNGFDAFYGELIGTMNSKKCLHKEFQINKENFLILGGDCYDNMIETFYYNKENKILKNNHQETFGIMHKLLEKNIKKCFKDSRLQKNLLL